MNRRPALFAAVFAVAMLGNLFAVQGQEELPPSNEFKTVKEQASYGIGLNIGNSLRREQLDVDTAALVRGLRDAIAGMKPSLTDEQLDAALAAFQRETAAKQAERAKAAADKNTKEGQAFLAANKTAAGVVTLPSGLQYKVIKAGTGAKPKASDTVRTHYRGTLIDGTEFDSSIGGEPITFPVGGVIAGWTEALQLMPVGSKWQLFIPSELAYGARGAGPVIGPHSVLVFDIELIAIEQ